MNTNFFVDQTVARRRTTLLVVMYISAVLLIIFLTYGFFALLARGSPSRQQIGLGNFIHDDLFLGIFAAVSGLIVLGSTYKIYSLARGGRGIAEMLGGKLIESNRTDPELRRVLNIVEETAIAAGVPVPPVYLLGQENSINAFAAGYSASDAVIAVSKGCVDKLTRDELQGVIAHEFSHILNGDMRLNIRLIGVLHGILLLGLLGQFSMRSAAEVDDVRGSLALLVIGLGLFILGYLGVFFGNVIKAAISRQREFLADASAVQFTRNPLGIGSALHKILLSSDYKLKASHAAEASHFYFSSGLTEAFFGLLSTHPPLVERIKRIAPSLLTQQVSKSASLEQMRRELIAEKEAGVSGFSSQVFSDPNGAATSAIERSKKLLSGLPQIWRDSAHEPASAQAVVLGVLLSSDQEERNNQLSAIENETAPQIMSELARLAASGIPQSPQERFALVEMSVPSLRSMSPPQLKQFRSVIDSLINSDGRISLFEYALGKTLRRHLERVVSPQLRIKPDERSLSSLLSVIAVLLEHVAFVGASSHDQRCVAYQAGMRFLFPNSKAAPTFSERPSYQQLDSALASIECASAHTREQIMRAVVECVMADGHASPSELQIVRAIADHIECPIPLLEQ